VEGGEEKDRHVRFPFFELKQGGGKGRRGGKGKKKKERESWFPEGKGARRLGGRCVLLLENKGGGAWDFR